MNNKILITGLAGIVATGCVNETQDGKVNSLDTGFIDNSYDTSDTYQTNSNKDDEVGKWYENCDITEELSAGDMVTDSSYDGKYTFNYLWQDYVGGIKELQVNEESIFDPTIDYERRFTLSSGEKLKVSEVVNQNYAGGIHSLKICLIK